VIGAAIKETFCISISGHQNEEQNHHNKKAANKSSKNLRKLKSLRRQK
jgi:hypothetical protein